MPPTTPTRKAILAAIVTRLAVITVANGYATDLGLTQYVNEVPTQSPDDPSEAMAIVIGTEQPTWQGNKVFITLPFEVQILVPPSDVAWRAVEDGVADVKRAMEVDHDLGGLLPQQFPIKRGAVQTYLREAGQTTVGAGVPYEVSYTEGWGQP
jgi:hypothetical protein